MRLIPAAVFTLALVLALIAARSCADARDDMQDLVLVGTAERVVDGDTIDVVLASGKIRVRVWGIDTPERGQPLAEEASTLLRQLVDDGRNVELQPAGQTSYDRMVARVFVDGTDVGAEVVKRGFAMAERRYLDQFPDGASYCTFEHSARSAKSGIWSLRADRRVAPWEWRRRASRTTPFTDYGNAPVASCVAAIGKPLAP